MTEAAKNLFFFLSALFPIVDPLGGSPIFLAMTRGILAADATGAVVADCHEQFSPAGRLVLHRNAHPLFLWHFVAGGAGGRRIDRHLRGLGAAETGKRRRPEGCEDKHAASGPIPQRLLSLDVTVDGWTRIDLRGHHAGCECPTTSGAQPPRHFVRSCWLGSARGEYFSLLRIFRSYRKGTGPDGDDRDHPTYLIPAGVHRRADFVEWRQRAFGVGSPAPALSGAECFRFFRL